MSVSTSQHSLRDDTRNGAGVIERRSTETTETTETKAAFRTTEFVAYAVTVVGVLLASYLVGDADGRGDVFLADKAWFYVTLLTIGYLVSRGLAKSGSRARYDA